MKKRIVTVVAAALLVSQMAVMAQHDFNEYKERAEKIELFEQEDESVTDNNYSGNVEFDVSEKPEYVKVFAFDAVMRQR